MNVIWVFVLCEHFAQTTHTLKSIDSLNPLSDDSSSSFDFSESTNFANTSSSETPTTEKCGDFYGQIVGVTGASVIQVDCQITRVALSNNFSLTFANGVELEVSETIDLIDNSVLTVYSSVLDVTKGVTLIDTSKYAELVVEDSTLTVENSFSTYTAGSITLSGNTTLYSGTFNILQDSSLVVQNTPYIQPTKSFNIAGISFLSTGSPTYTINPTTSSKVFNIHSKCIFSIEDDSLIQCDNFAVFETASGSLSGNVKVLPKSNFQVYNSAELVLKNTVSVITKTLYVFNNGNLVVQDNSSILCSSNFKASDSAFIQIMGNAVISFVSTTFTKAPVIEMYNSSVFKATQQFTPTEQTFVTMYNHSSIQTLYVNLKGDAQLIMNDNSSIVSSSNIRTYDQSILEIRDSTHITCKGYFQVQQSAKLIMFNYSILNIKNHLLLTDDGVLELKDETKMTTPIMNLKANGLIVLSGKSVLNITTLINGLEYSEIEVTEQSILVTPYFNLTNSKISLASQKLFASVNVGYFMSTNGSVFSEGNSYFEVDTFNVTLNLLQNVNRDVFTYPLFDVQNVEQINISTIESSSDFDIITSHTIITTTIPSGTHLLQDGKLLRYGNSEMIYCHMKFNTIRDDAYEEPHCPCYGVNCTLVPNSDFSEVFINDNNTFVNLQSTTTTQLVFGENVDDAHVKISNQLTIKFSSDFSNQSVDIINSTFNATQTSFTIGEYKMSIKSLNVKDVVVYLHGKVNPKKIQIEQSTIPMLFMSDNGFLVEINETSKVFLIVYYNNGQLEFHKETIPYCEKGYILENNLCQKDVNCKMSNGESCVKCYDGYKAEKKRRCYVPDNHCQLEFDNNCKLCSPNDTYVNNSWSCDKKVSNYKTKDNNKIITCLSGFYLTISGCSKCNELEPNCKYCDNEKCTVCDDKYEFNSTLNCVLKECYSTEPVQKDENGKCDLKQEQCKRIVNGICVECTTGHFKNSSHYCNNYKDENCTTQHTKGCTRCKDSFYYNSSTEQCDVCDTNCLTCYNKADFCTSCEDGYYLSENKCILNTILKEKCDTLSVNGRGCYSCKSGYYREKLDCEPCSISCSTCINGLNCIQCNTSNYQIDTGECVSRSSLIGCGVDVTSVGCTQCADGYYLVRGNQCAKCFTTCTTCESQDVCHSCVESYILIKGTCVHFESVEKCLHSSNSKCDKCTFWRSPSNDGSYCVYHIKWWLLLVLILFIITVSIFIIFVVYKVSNLIMKKRHIKELKKNIHINKIKRLDIDLILLKGGVCVDKNVVDFTDESGPIPVGVETVQFLNVGNTTSKSMKIQITTANSTEKLKMRVEPPIVCIRKGEICEFKICITPQFTTNLDNEHIAIITYSMKTDLETVNSIPIKAETQASYRLDPEDIIDGKKIGEGAFGIVLKGFYRGNVVALKKLKQRIYCIDNDEFDNELNMLEKFNSDYVIHYYGAVIVPNKVCVVTEFAEFGGFGDVMKKHKSDFLCDKMRVKIMLDASRGIEYLHNNGVLHRDIKPDNILVVSLEEDITVNGKLTDFGSSRNFNMLITNMTFTKGIGTPKYMAPEMIGKKRYNMQTDIYSFAVTMYETFGWCNIYTEAQFKFPWNVVDFVLKGNRESKPDGMKVEMYSLIEDCWKQDQEDRLKISEVVARLQAMYDLF
ncbi:protein serine/threonine kinase, putative [Entamoeba invadens IP1]|uniref:Protein serine/threonine kinase, putative n=1 Tax=Entamoeba invadens IP1 TaxID=370355 RepID=A0A0A1U185_ENTIV|nr:protein serine/threonine kinase, putative [Entamoeba invadens IP1]ELP84668.1 protein serine/threonine kinase, putative [Entamoeba invadens IP1]|eukprot:XP_004184014.1 protein serine/threonine kinase, putative [Entamoeba invadens IP1]